MACFSSLYITSSQPVAEGSHSGEGRSQHRLPLQRVSSRGWVWGLQKENKSPWRTPGAIKAEWAREGVQSPPLHTAPLTPAVGMGPIFPPQQQVPEDTAQFPLDSSSPPTPVCIIGTQPASWAGLPSQASPQAPTSHHGHNSPSAFQQNS